MGEREGKRSVNIGYRATPAEARRLDAACEVLGTTRSRLIRKATNEAVEVIAEDFDPEAHARDLRDALEPEETENE